MTRICVCMLLLVTSCAQQASNSETTLVRIRHMENEQAETSRQLKTILEQMEVLTEQVKQLNRIVATSEQIKQLNATVATLRARPPVPRPTVRPRPDKTSVYSVPIAGNPYVGRKYAKVTLVKAFEFACPYSNRVRPTIAQLRKDYGSDLKVVYKNYVVHPNSATIPAHASCAAHNQGKYIPMYRLIWEKGFKQRNFGADTMEKIAKQLRLNVRRFKADMNGPDCKRIVQTDMRQLAAVGTRGTPMFYINGRFLSGAQPIGRFKTIIDQELKKANEAIRKGASLKTYYRDYVVKKGKSTL